MPLNSPNDIFGSVGGYADTIIANPVLTVAGLYAIGDYVGTSGVPISFANALRLPGGTGFVFSALLVDKTLQSKALELWLFSESVTPPADNAAWTISDADAAKCVGVIPFSTYYASALNSVSPVDKVGVQFELPAGVTTLYGCLVARAAGTWASLDLIVKLSIAQD